MTGAAQHATATVTKLVIRRASPRQGLAYWNSVLKKRHLEIPYFQGHNLQPVATWCFVSQTPSRFPSPSSGRVSWSCVTCKTHFDEEVAKMILLYLDFGGLLLTCANMAECSHEGGIPWPGQGFSGEG
ncbi:hypothetical protein LCI18_005484 [Fusarium solani-melongenae]|uniref:Uncharacterized protein n=1 Tax=Fusarium solani subsp. cucurbitae TaxID=2747967 RepID=A0ACD3YZW5_FUSSC|nr:hypothetical protein LCI18_005484 [Fusarium solani-melongenae]